MVFRDRMDAAQALIVALAPYRGENPLVLGIPRGGVPIAAEIARALGGELDVVLVRKIGAPHHSEFAIGAVTESGSVALDPRFTGRWPKAVLDRAIDAEKRKIAARRARYSRFGRVDPAGRVVLVVDDGIATGQTLLAAIRALREEGAARIVAVAPVASREAVAALSEAADEVVVSSVPAFFAAVSRFYEDFSEVSDEDVERCLAREARREVSSPESNDRKPRSHSPAPR